MQGKYDPEYKEIVDAIPAIIFLSTPHDSNDSYWDQQEQDCKTLEDNL